jgi:hypothetical protein
MRAWIELGENMGGGASELERRFRSDRLYVRHAADAICAKYFLRLRHVGYSKAANAIRKEEGAAACNRRLKAGD